MSLQKRAPRYSADDWFTNLYTQWSNTEKLRLLGRDVVEEGKYLRNEADSKEKWDQLETNTRLADKIDRIRVITKFLESKLQLIDQEISNSAIIKNIIEKLQDYFNQMTQINIENLTMREGRRGIDLVVDEAEEELQKEKEILDGVKWKLQNKNKELFGQIKLLKEVRHKVARYLQVKDESSNMDIDLYNKTSFSPSISFKPNSLETDSKTLSLKEWEEIYCAMKDLTLKAHEQAMKSRENIKAIIDSITNDLNSQSSIVQFALRKRMHEMEMAIHEDKFQKGLIEAQISRLEEEIRCLEVSIKSKMASLKLAQSRAEDRKMKEDDEKVMDNVYRRLCDEVAQLETSIQALKKKMCQAFSTINELEKQIHQLNEDISNKKMALFIDEQCLESRKRINPDCSKLINELKETIFSCVKPDAF